ncbi:MAG: hypothetical protein JXB48_01590 [Candidatus Latescibacteria bacterium]|nr:hypothetical protein [Candidatus Latescibacterota bacterium]
MPTINSQDNRRDFLKKSSLAAIGTSIAMKTGYIHAQNKSGRPYVTGRKDIKLVGCYCSTDEILNQPKYMDALQTQLGVNAVICRSAIKMPEWLKNLNPFNNSIWMGISPAKNDDDSELVKAIDEVHSRGMDFWLYYSGIHYGARSRELCAETFEGIPFSEIPHARYAYCQDPALTAVCVNKPSVVEWHRAVYQYGAKNYDVDAVKVTHFRYANPAFFGNLFGCACEYCQEKAYSLGYDFHAMKKACQNLRQNLKMMDKSKVVHAAKTGFTFTDFLQIMADDRAVIDWFYFRAASMGNRLKEIHDSIHQATADRACFITDTHHPTHSLYIGHNYADLANGASDGLMPLAWLDAQYLSAVATWANLLITWVPSLEEETAITVILNFFGWDDLTIPRKKIADLHIGNDRTDHIKNKRDAFYSHMNESGLTLDLMTHEMERLALLNTKGMPAFPVIKGDSWTKKICLELMDRCMAMGHTGYIIQQTDLIIDKQSL